MTTGELTIEIIHLGCELRRICNDNSISNTEKRERINELKRQIEELRAIRGMMEI